MTQEQKATIVSLVKEGNSVKVSEIKKALKLRDKVADVATMLQSELADDVRFCLMKKGNAWVLFFEPEIKNQVVNKVRESQDKNGSPMGDYSLECAFCRITEAKGRDEIKAAADWKNRVMAELCDDGKIEYLHTSWDLCYSVTDSVKLYETKIAESEVLTEPEAAQVELAENTCNQTVAVIEHLINFAGGPGVTLRVARDALQNTLHYSDAMSNLEVARLIQKAVGDRFSVVHPRGWSLDVFDIYLPDALPEGSEPVDSDNFTTMDSHETFWSTFKQGMTADELHALLDERMTFEGVRYYVDDPRMRHIDGKLYTPDYIFPDELKAAVREARVRDAGATPQAIQSYLPERCRNLKKESVVRNLEECPDIVKLANGNYDVKEEATAPAEDSAELSSDNLNALLNPYVEFGYISIKILNPGSSRVTPLNLRCVDDTLSKYVAEKFSTNNLVLIVKRRNRWVLCFKSPEDYLVVVDAPSGILSKACVTKHQAWRVLEANYRNGDIECTVLPFAPEDSTPDPAVWSPGANKSEVDTVLAALTEAGFIGEGTSLADIKAVLGDKYSTEDIKAVLEACPEVELLPSGDYSLKVEPPKPVKLEPEDEELFWLGFQEGDTFDELSFRLWDSQWFERDLVSWRLTGPEFVKLGDRYYTQNHLDMMSIDPRITGIKRQVLDWCRDVRFGMAKSFVILAIDMRVALVVNEPELRAYLVRDLFNAMLQSGELIESNGEYYLPESVTELASKSGGG